jgi:hypothetical protein
MTTLIAQIEDRVGKLNDVPDAEYGKAKGEIVEAYKAVCFDSKLDASVRSEAFLSFMYCVPIDGLDAYRRLRDMISYAGATSIREKLGSLLKRITLGIELKWYINARSRGIIAHEIMTSAVQLYNLGDIAIYEILEKLVVDHRVPQHTRLDALKYIYASCDDQKREFVQRIVGEMINSEWSYQLDCDLHDDDELKSTETSVVCVNNCPKKIVRYTSKERYELILAPYFSRRGIVTAMISQPILVPVDPYFIIPLQLKFFWDKGNGVREKCLSSQMILDASDDLVPVEEKLRVCNELLCIGNDVTLEEKLRADAIDVVLRCGSPELRVEARALIKQLGYSSVNRNAVRILDRIAHVYNNTQNVHSVPDECVEEFCDKLMTDTNVQSKTFDDAFKEVHELTRRLIDDPHKRFDALDSLNRVSIDTATFSKHKLTTQEIFVYVWQRILLESGDMRNTLEQIFVDELTDMNGWCSTGNADRFILVLQPIESIIRFDYVEQIISNFATRMAKRIESLGDENRKGLIMNGMIRDTAEEHERTEFLEYFEENATEIHEELYREFVDAGHVTAEDFERYFNDAKQRWMM